MATTKREKKVKVEYKKGEKLPPLPIEEEIVKVDEIPAQKDHLDPAHLMQLEVLSRDIEIAKFQMSTEEQELQNLLLSMEILKTNIEKKRLSVSSKAARYEATKVKFSNFKKEIWPMYGLTENEGLGYDPVSGLIHRN